jgi:hypothetical protein
MVVDNPILRNIIPHISTEERYNLFDIVDKLLKGNYKEKSKVLEIKQSALYQYRQKKLEISDAKTLLLLKLLHDKNIKEFKLFLEPILKVAERQISNTEDCLNSGLLDLDLNIIQKLFDIYSDYDRFCNSLEQKHIETEKKIKKISKKPYGRIYNLDMYQLLYNALQNDKSHGVEFLDGDPEAWSTNYYFWKKITRQIRFIDEKNNFTRSKIPNGYWWEHLFESLREYNLFEDNSGKDELHRAFQYLKYSNPILNNEVLKRDNEDKRKDYRDDLRFKFNRDTEYNLDAEKFKDLLDYCGSLFSSSSKMPTIQGIPKSPDIKNNGIKEIADILRPHKPPESNLIIGTDLTMMG